MKNSLIKLSNVTKIYQVSDIKLNVLRDISLTVYEGEFIAVVGPSGSGKSTLMNIIGLLDTPTSGTYILNNQNTKGLSEDALSEARNREIGFVFQSFNLLPRATALDNVILPAIYKGVHRDKRTKLATNILIELGLGNKLINKPNQLSGGQQQRVAVARALINDPSIILADEPTGNLDSKSGEEVLKILRDLNKKGKTVIVITHEKEIAKKAKRIVRMKDGKIV